MTEIVKYPNVSKARLPETYSAAKLALANCTRVDECKTWADRAAAMASYAKQADDESLHKMATKIKARAIKRCGELLRQIAPSAGGRPKSNGKPMSPAAQVSRSQAAKDAGLSHRQKNTALRLASIPGADFEAAVESERPPTVTELAKLGTKPKPKPKPLASLRGRSPADVKLATKAYGQLERLAEFAADADPKAVARGELAKGRRKMHDNAGVIQTWLKRLMKECKK